MTGQFNELESRFQTIFNEWHIVREIGRGTYGSVYEIQRSVGGVTDKAALKHISFPKDAYDLQAICAEVGTNDEGVIRDYIYQSVQEYRAEYQIMRELKGLTNIVSCEDFQVIDKQDMPGYDIFIRMELLETVSNLMRQEPFSRNEVIRLGIDICNALKLLNKKHILHRDIKPENIFRNENGDYKLGDFGSARIISGSRAVVTAKGTPAYMAPEILLLKEAGAYTDIYSLGLVMFRLMNENRSPFVDGGSSTTMSREEAASRRVSGEKLPKPVNADEELAQVILKACEFKPENRYQTPDEMMKDLQALLSKSEAEEKAEKQPAAEPEAGQQERLSNEGTHLGRRTVLTPEERQAIKEAEERRIREEQEKEERERAEKERIRQEKKKKTIITVFSVVAALIVLAVGTLLIVQASRKRANYEEAIAMMENNDPEGAQAILADFEDSYQETAEKKQQLEETLKNRDNTFTEAKAAIEKQIDELKTDELNAAVSNLKGIQKLYPDEGGKKQEISDLIGTAENKIKVLEALALAGTDSEKAAKTLETLGEADRAEAVRKEALYNSAMDKMEKNDPEGALAILGNYEDEYMDTAAKKQQLEETLKTRDESFEKAKAAIGKEPEVLKEEELSEAIASLKDIQALYPRGEKREEIRELLNTAEHKTRALKALADAEKDPDKAAKNLEAIGESDRAQRILNEKEFKEAFSLAGDENDTKLIGLGMVRLSTLKNRGYRAEECQNQINLGTARINYLNAKALLEEGAYTEAAEKFDHVAQNKDYAWDAATRANEARARAYLKEEKYKEAVNLLKNADSTDEKIQELAAAASAGMEKADKFAEAEKSLKDAIKQYREFNSNAAEDVKRQNFIEAKKKCDDAGRAFADLAKAEFTLKGVSASDKKTECENWSVYLEGRIQLLDGEFASARYSFGKVPEFQDADAWKTRAQIEELRQQAENVLAGGDTDGARKLYQQVKELDEEAGEEGLEKVQKAEDDKATYEEAVRLFENKEYQSAIETVKMLATEGYPGAQELLEQLGVLNDRKSTYDKACKMEEEQNYSGAQILFEKISDFEDAEQHIETCQQHIDYEKACKAIDAGQLSEAEGILKVLNKAQFDGAEDKLHQIADYQDASNKQNNGKFGEALEIFNRLKEAGFYDAAIRANECDREVQYETAVSLMGSDPETAKGMFEKLGDLNESAENLKKCDDAINYAKAQQAMEASDYSGALTYLNQLNNYNYGNSVDMRSTCEKNILYNDAVKLMNQGEYKAANDKLSSEALKGFLNSNALAAECQYEIFCEDVSGGGDVYTITRNAYRYIFEQDIDRNNKLNWAKKIPTDSPTGADLAVGFAYTSQFEAQNIPNAERLRVLYNVLLNNKNPEEDPAFAEYLGYLDGGMSARYILAKMFQRSDFRNLCSNEGIKIGDIELTESRDQDFDTTRFVFHCYMSILINHVPNGDELNEYTEMIREERITLESLLLQFINSPECKAANLDDEEYVRMLYRAFFGREMEDAEVAYNEDLLKGEWSRESLANVLSQSKDCQEYLLQFRPAMRAYLLNMTLEEFRAEASGGAPVNEFAANAYGFIFNRSKILAEDKKAWAASLKIGGTVSDLITSFIDYPAYGANVISNAERVSALYMILLGRVVDPASDPGSNAFLTAMDNGMSSWYVVRSIIGSQEFIGNCEARNINPGTFDRPVEPRDANYNLTLLVARCYREGLGRTANPEELNDWTSRYLNQSMTLQQLMINLLTCQEARDYMADNEVFVNTLYNILLERPADEFGLQEKLSALSQGTNRQSVMESIFPVEEYVHKWRDEKQLLPME